MVVFGTNPVVWVPPPMPEVKCGLAARRCAGQAPAAATCPADEPIQLCPQGPSCTAGDDHQPNARICRTARARRRTLLPLPAPPFQGATVASCGSATLDVLGTQHPVHILGPQPGQLVLTPAGVRIGAVEADHDVGLGPASRLGGPEVLA
jgi:hypothetical protein